MQTLSVSVDSIEVGERHRALSEAAVEHLAASIKAIGLRQPISIRIVDLMVIDGQECEGVPVLVAGRHRLEAVKRLGQSNIDCIEVTDDELSAELWEIAENLHRHDLTKEQRDEHIRRYAELLGARDAGPKNQVPQNDAPEIGYKKPPPQEKGIARRIADETGLSKSTVERALKPTSRRPNLAPAGKQLAKLRQAWREACPAVRQHFLTEIREMEQAA